MRIALIGSAPSSIMLAPFKDASYAAYMGGKPQIQPPTPHLDESWKIWACSPGVYGIIPRADAYFELHRWEPGKPWFSPEYCQFLREFKGPVYTGGHVPELPTGEMYPIKEIEGEFSSYFLTSSLALMFALALYKLGQMDKQHDAHGLALEQHTIGMWGVDMAANEEYGYQRAGCQYFLLEAMRRGYQIYVPPESDLLRPMPVYGLCEWDHNWIKATARMQELQTRESNAMHAARENEQTLSFFRGARENQKYNMDTWTSPYGLRSGEYVRRVDTPDEAVVRAPSAFDEALKNGPVSWIDGSTELDANAGFDPWTTRDAEDQKEIAAIRASSMSPAEKQMHEAKVVGLAELHKARANKPPADPAPEDDPHVAAFEAAKAAKIAAGAAMTEASAVERALQEAKAQVERRATEDQMMLERALEARRLAIATKAAETRARNLATKAAALKKPRKK